MSSVIKIIFVSVVLSAGQFIPCSVMAEDGGLSFSYRVIGGGYSGQNTTSGTEFQSDEGNQSALSMAYQSGNFYTGLSLQGGQYTFTRQAPDQVTPAGTKQVSNDKVTHSEIGLIFGYYIIPNVSVYFGIKGVSDTWESNQHQQEFAGGGLGVSGYKAITPNWAVYGSIAWISSGELKYNGEKYGEGTSRSVDIGGLYKFTQSHRLIFGIKRSVYHYKYDSGDEQDHYIGGGFVGYSYAMGL